MLGDIDKICRKKLSQIAASFRDIYKLYLKPMIIKQGRLISKEKKHYGKKCIRVICETRPEQVDNY